MYIHICMCVYIYIYIYTHTVSAHMLNSQKFKPRVSNNIYKIKYIELRVEP